MFTNSQSDPSRGYLQHSIPADGVSAYLSPNSTVLTSRQATISNMNIRCNNAPTTDCMLAEDNELGFGSYYGAKDYCRQANETCCQNLTAALATPIAAGCFQPLFGVITCDLLYGFIVFFVFALISAVFSILFGQERKKHPYTGPHPTSQTPSNYPLNRNNSSQGWPSTSTNAGGPITNNRYTRPPSTQFVTSYPPQSRVVSVMMPPVVMLPPPGAAPWNTGAVLAVPNAPSESSGRSRAASDAELVKVYRVIQSFRPEQEGDIELLVGDQVTVTQDLGGGWVSGMNIRTQLEGVFPQSHAV
ncbi:hypothetical protein HK096_009250 [Nowakowskiella sp. JEL0078]|nr:hypothetical protein HK096_009250 [Nowakowskiella sp. JEL0078]